MSFPAVIPCPLGGDMHLLHWFPHIWTQRAGREFALYWSTRWKFGTLYPTPTDDELTCFYDSAGYDAYMAGGRNTEETARARSVLTRLEDMVIFRLARWVGDGEGADARMVHQRLGGKASRVCDVGCGPGLMLSELASMGHDVVGVDPNPVALKAGRERGLTMFEGHGEAFPDGIPMASLDALTMVQSLEHTRDPRLALSNAAARLKPGGLLIAEVPNHGCLSFRQRGAAWYHTDAGRHIQFFSPRSLEALMQQVGLNVRETGFAGYSAQFVRVEEERRVWDHLYKNVPVAGPAAPSPRAGPLARISLLMQTLFAAPEARHDMVWVVAQKPA